MTERCMTEWCEAIRLTKCQSDNEGTEPTLAQLLLIIIKNVKQIVRELSRLWLSVDLIIIKNVNLITKELSRPRLSVERILI